MAVDGMKFLLQLRKLAIRTMKASSRSVRNHPVLTGIFLFVMLLYRSSPFLFSLLVSASPVLVCTAVLLGTLLSFGNPQIPEIDMDEKINCEISSLTAGFVPNSTTVYQKEADGDVGDSAAMGELCSVSRFQESLLTPQNSREIVFEQRSVEEEVEKDEFKSREVEFSKENFVDDHFEESNLTFEGAAQERGFENEGSDDGNVDDHGDVESSSVPWTRVNNDHGDDEDDDEEEEDDDDDDDSGSDGAESSSPDPSMADIIPLLDELHPLIECEGLIPHNQSHEDPGEETDHNSVEEEEEEEGGDDDVEEENSGEKEDTEKSAITWTEDDQKNLMDLGSSELERNQRLESLIARRRARKSNLIDLDDLVLPFQISPISTARQNPFEIPNDTFDNMDLPPIPGSAPSIMLKRRNPFDIPYDSGEEKPDLMDDSFREEFTPNIQKEPVFRRHESFHVGSSFFEFPRQEPRDFQRVSRFKPYFIPERLASEGESSFNSYMRQSSAASDESSFHLSFQRQLSDMSESKASSVTEIELVTAEIDREETKVDDTEIDHASEHVEHGSQSSENFDDQIEKSDFDLHMPEIVLGESENRIGVEINLGSSGNDRDVDSWVSEARDLAAIEGIIEGDMNLNASAVEDKHDDVKEANEGSVLMENSDVQSENLFNTSDFHHHERSVFDTNLTLETIEEEHIISPSSSLTSEEGKITEGLKTDEDLMNVDSVSPDNKNTDTPTELAVDSSNFGLNMDFDESQIKDPVYDLSPQASRINLSISSEELADLENKELGLEQDCLLHESVVEDDCRVDREEQFMSEAEHSSAQADFFSTDNVLTEEPELANEDAKVANVSDTVDEQLISVAEEGESVEDRCLINSPPFHYEEEPFVVPEKLEEVISENREMNDLLSLPLQTVETSTTVQELPQEHVTDFIDFSEPVEGRVNFEFESSIIGDADEKSPSTETFVPQTDIITELDEALLSELDVVGDFHVTEPGMAFEAENTEAGINELQDSHISEDNIQFGPLKGESVENIEKPSDENTLKSSSDVFFINESQPEVQNAEAIMGEFEYSQVMENEPIENVEKSDSEVLYINAHKPKEEDLDTGLPELIESQVLESMTMSQVPEPESSHSDEIFGTINSAIETDELITSYCDTSENQKETVIETTEFKRSDDAAIDTVIEKDEPAEEKISEFVHAKEEEIERSGVADIDVSLDCKKDESDEEKINEFVHVMEEEIERSSVDAAVDLNLDSREVESGTFIEKGESDEEINEFVHVMEEEVERSAIDASFDSDGLNDDLIEKDELLIEKDEQPAAGADDEIPAVVEEIERFTIDAFLDSSDSKIDAQIEKDEQPASEPNDLVPAMEEQVERYKIDASSDSEVSKNDAEVDSVPAIEEEIISIDASINSYAPKNDALIENEETNDSVPAMEEKIEGAQIEKDEQLAADSNESVSAMDEEIERSFIDAFSVENAEAGTPDMEEEVEGDNATAVDESSDSHISTNKAQIEEDEQPAAEANESVPATEEEIERSAIDAFTDSQLSENNALIEKDEQLAAESNESVPAMEEAIERSFVDTLPTESAEAVECSPAMEEEIEGPGADNTAIDTSSESYFSENIALNPQSENTETNESALVMEEEREFVNADTNASLDSDLSKNEAQILKDELVPAMEGAIDAFSDSQSSENDVLNPLIENTETIESSLVMEEEKEFVNADTLDSHVLNSETVIEKDAEEMENNQDESFPESEQLTSAQNPTGLQLESAQSQALQEEDHQMGQTQLSIDHLSTEIASVTEETVIQGSSDTAPQTPKREEE